MITSTCKEKGKTNSFDIKKEEAKEKEWKCPLCDKPTTYVKRGVDGTIPHFRHLEKADHPKISESVEHSKAKHKIFKKIKKDNQYVEAELEKPIDDQIADIFVQLEDGKKIAIEVQCSTQGKQKFIERTRRYNKKNIAPVWLLKKDNFAPFYNKYTDTLNFKKSVRWIQKNWYGRCYFFNDSYEVTPYRLTSKSEWVEGNDFHSGYTKYYKTRAKYSKGEIDNHGIFFTTSNGLKIARFYDKAWWNN